MFIVRAIINGYDLYLCQGGTSFTDSYDKADRFSSEQSGIAATQAIPPIYARHAAVAQVVPA